MRLYGKNQPSDTKMNAYELDHERMAILLGITGDTFEAIKKTISCNKDAKLRSIRDELNESFTYNQVRSQAAQAPAVR